MGHALSSSGRPWAPQAPGHGTDLRASGTTQRQRCPGAEDPASRCATWRASGTTKRSAREGGS
jgi:hypothetical protein